MPSESTNKRIAKNTLLLYVRMLLTMAIGLYTSRVVLAELGISDYGLYSVVGGIVTMFTFINGSLNAGTQRFLTFELVPILGYRIGQLGYITDMLTMPEESYEQLAGIDVLIVNALRIAPHPTHQDLEEALAVAQRIRAKKTYFIHMSHDMGLHAEVERKLPENIHLAYDGLEILL